MSFSLTKAELELLDQTNYGVNYCVRSWSGLVISNPPAGVLKDKVGTSAEVAFLKLALLYRRGVEINKLALGNCRKTKESYALVRGEWKPLLGSKRPCWLVLSRTTVSIRPLHRSEARAGLEINSFAQVALSLHYRLDPLL